jgi:RHS repeat-associated protein
LPVSFNLPAPQQQSGAVTIDYVYDPLYRLNEADYSTGDYYHYTYDAVGNRLTETTQLAVNSYQYDVANRMTDVNGVPYTWDNNGNLLNDGVNTYAYDAANRLTAISGQQSAVYGYNGLGDRLSQNGVDYTLDLNAGLTQVLSDGTNTYLYGVDRITQVNTTTLVTDYFLGDALGSVRQLTDATGEITLAKSYQPYGEMLASVGNGASPFAFTGEQQDVSGLTYLRARYYSSGDGRFTSKDTWMGDYNSPLSLNRWLYAYAQPINNTDPSGLQTYHFLFADFQDDYGDNNRTAARWTNQEITIVHQALTDIAIAYAKAYNEEAAKRGLINDDCIGFELYVDPTTPKIDPFTAFHRIHNTGQKLIIYKHSGGAPDVYGGAGTWGTGLSERQLDIWARGHFDRAIDYLTGYGQVGLNIGMDNYKRFVIHEMGHVFDHTVNKRLGIYPRTLVTGNLATGSNTIANGFCAPKFGYGDNPYGGWQWRFTNDSGEYFADMFVSWTYSCWEHRDDFPSRLTDIGQERSDFMNENMTSWIYTMINYAGVLAE